jgi:hypothetical protein
MKPFFLTVDTEGDNIWSRPKIIDSKNVEQLERFQLLCNEFDIRPIYLVNYEAAINLKFQKFVKQFSTNLEIGLHLHAWNSPPTHVQLSNDDYHHQPYLHEFPNQVITDKLMFMIKLLEETFNTSIISHRGGRYSTSDYIFSELVRLGIKVDCSMTPGINWSSSKGNPNGCGGPDYRNVPNGPFYIDTKYGKLLELPVSTLVLNSFINGLGGNNLIKRVYHRLFGPSILAFRSTMDNNDQLFLIMDHILLSNNPLQFIIHSSELVSGCSPLIKDKEQETKFYANLRLLFQQIRLKGFQSFTFKQYLGES